MGTLQSWRKAYGALKDSTQVGLAKINSDFKDLDIAIVKATNHDECPPKERHIRRLFYATSVARPRSDVAYCIHALGRRLHKTKNWIVALKTLVVIHRTLREGDPIFRDELLQYSHRGQVLQISNFKDDSSPMAWDCSAWVRTYAQFIEERLECFRILKYDIETERLLKSSRGTSKKHSRTRNLGCQDSLEQLPALQQFLFRLIGCQPEGLAYNNYLIQYALALILKESFKLYCAINDGIINLVDMFFEMSRHDAVKALSIYKRAGQQAESLAEFYEFCKGLELARNFQFPNLRQPPPSFLGTMEEYIKEAPPIGSSSKPLEFHEKTLLTYKEEALPPEIAEPPVEAENILEEPKEDVADVADEPIPQEPADLLCITEVNPAAADLDESNSLALAIISPRDNAGPSTSNGILDIGGSGWELALVTTPSSNVNHVAERKLAGGFHKLLLDSLYEDADNRRQQNTASYGGASSTPNPFAAQDPFSISNGIAPPTNVQMAMMAQQQNNMMMTFPYNYSPYNNQPQPPMTMGTSTPNPFGDPFAGYSQNVPTQGNHNLI